MANRRRVPAQRHGRPAPKRLALHRARFLKGTSTPLQTWLSQALAKCTDVKDTRVTMSEYGKFEIAERDETSTDIALHVVGFAPKESAGTVNITAAGKQDALKAARPPRNRAFHTGAFMLLIRGNNVFCCGDSIRASGAASYLRQLFGRADLDPQSQAFELLPVADAKKMEMLQTEGVKQIDLDATLYAATLDASKEELPLAGVFQRLLQGLQENLDAYVREDLKQTYADQLGELQVKLTIKPNKGKRGELIARNIVDTAGQDILRQDEAGKSHEGVGFTLVTGNDNKITAKNATIGEQHSFARKLNENVLDHTVVWEALRAFADKIERSGVAGQ